MRNEFQNASWKLTPLRKLWGLINVIDAWYTIDNADQIASPSVLVYPDRIAENLTLMIRAVGDVKKLRPHVKTHKMAKVIELKLDAGIDKFKASTIAEVEMVLDAGGVDVLLAYQPVGPNIDRLIQLIKKYPLAKIAAIVDNELTLLHISEAAMQAGVQVPLYIDLNVGMNRTGIAPLNAAALFRSLSAMDGVIAAGLHAYDGHLHDANPILLEEQTKMAFEPVWDLIRSLKNSGYEVPNIIASGTPTSELLAQYEGVEVSAGTTVLWDAGQPRCCPTMPYQHSAVLLCRVISRPDARHICIDLGHKAVASEFPQPRVKFFGLEDAKAVAHSEEHLVLQTSRADEFPPGSVLYGLPYHVCPTIALHASVWCVRERQAVEQWPVTARNRSLSI